MKKITTLLFLKKITAIVLAGAIVLGRAANAAVEENQKMGKETGEIQKEEKGIKQVELPIIRREKIESGDKIMKGVYIFRQKDIPANILKKIKKNKDNKMNVIGESKTAKYFILATWLENENKKIVNSKYLISDRIGNTVKTIDTSWLGEHPSGINGWHLSERGEFIWQNGAMYRFYGNEEKPIKEIVVKNESTKGIIVDNNDKFLIVCEDTVEMFDLRGDELWKNKVGGKIEPQSLITSENGRYFAFEVREKNARPSTVVMDIDGNVVREFGDMRAMWSDNIAISNDGRYLIGGDSLYNLSSGQKIRNFNIADKLPDLWDTKWYYTDKEIREIVEQMVKKNYTRPTSREVERRYKKLMAKIKEQTYRGTAYLDGKKILEKYPIIGMIKCVQFSENGNYILFLINENENKMLNKRPPKGHIIITDIEGKNIFRQTFDYPLASAYFTEDGSGIRVIGGGETTELDISRIAGAKD